MFARIVLSLSLISSVAAARQCDGKGHCVDWTADKVAAERQLVCTYGKTRFESDPQGRTVVVMGKVCTEVKR